MPVQIRNDTNGTREILVEVRAADGESRLMARQARVMPQDTVHVVFGLVGHADYVLAAKAGMVEREVRVEFDSTTTYFRFIVEDDVIAFQSG